MIRIDRNGRDGGGRREDILLTYSPSFHFFLYILFSFFFSFLFPSFFSFFLFLSNFFFFFKDTSKFQKNLQKIRIWRSCFAEF